MSYGVLRLNRPLSYSDLPNTRAYRTVRLQFGTFTYSLLSLPGAELCPLGDHISITLDRALTRQRVRYFSLLLPQPLVTTLKYREHRTHAYPPYQGPVYICDLEHFIAWPALLASLLCVRGSTRFLSLARPSCIVKTTPTCHHSNASLQLVNRESFYSPSTPMASYNVVPHHQAKSNKRACVPVRPIPSFSTPNSCHTALEQSPARLALYPQPPWASRMP